MVQAMSRRTAQAQKRVVVNKGAGRRVQDLVVFLLIESVWPYIYVHGYFRLAAA
jgi:hypothetical protein